MNMRAMNALEQKVLDMVARGEKLHGLAKEVYIEMKLREMEEKA